ncbi:Arc family DNA-binding protein [Salmonella enterica]|nr:Arc family DNA-binding protein [Salmonella enterica]EHK3918169.1 Arc family DNA-binding protein [Salmonella enterica subsp. enterica serovar Poona]EKR1732402.1 Arc family DNA-binding protein [Salmonella enterica subsp. enterica serovar Madelia]MLT78430.1 hypothetical protein [Salmonella enterica subsp. enterica serovar Sandiego]EBI9418511.1 hypothetical protein [Salmonella enterica]
MSRLNPQFNVRISPELKEQVIELAKKNKRSINAEVVAALERSVRESGKVIQDENGDIHISLTKMEASLLESQLSMIKEISDMQKRMDNILEIIGKLENTR